MGLPFRLIATLAPLFLLSACLLTPGKFDSTLDIRRDGAFTFTYTGQVKAVDPSAGLKDIGKDSSEPKDDAKEKDAVYMPVAASTDSPGEPAGEDRASKLRAIAAALSKEKGFRSARYVGGDIIEVDYAISGRLDHSFVFPFNIDAEAAFPFVAIEVRKDGKVRVQAPGFGSSAGSDKAGGLGGMGDNDRAEGREGTFTLTTDAEIVSQNQEDGATTTPQGKRIVWKVTPLTKTAPMAVLKLEVQ